MAEEWNDDNIFVASESTDVVSNFLNGKSHGKVLASVFGPDNSVEEKLPSGSRVAFDLSVEAALTYQNPPLDGAEGTVVRMRSSHGNITHKGDFMFIRWDDGRVQSTHFSHLKKLANVETPDYNPKLVGKVSRMRVSSLGILADEFLNRTSNELIHKATKDLWSFSQGENGYVIERLFDDAEGPLKV